MEEIKRGRCPTDSGPVGCRKTLLGEEPRRVRRPQTMEGKEAPSFPETGASDNDTSHDGQYEPNERKIAMDQMLYEERDAIRICYHSWVTKPIAEHRADLKAFRQDHNDSTNEDDGKLL